MPELSETSNEVRSVLKRGTLRIPGLWGDLDDMESGVKQKTCFDVV